MTDAPDDLTPAQAEDLVRQAREGHLRGPDPLSHLLAAAIAPSPDAAAAEDAAAAAFRAAHAAHRRAQKRARLRRRTSALAIAVLGLGAAGGIAAAADHHGFPFPDRLPFLHSSSPSPSTRAPTVLATFRHKDSDRNGREKAAGAATQHIPEHPHDFRDPHAVPPPGSPSRADRGHKKQHGGGASA